MAQRRISSIQSPGGHRRSSRGLKPFIQERVEAQEIPEEPEAMVEPVPKVEPVVEENEASLTAKYSRFLIQLPTEKCTVAFYHHVANVTYREVVEGIQAALLAAYRPPNSIVSVELVPLQARCAEYYTENRWVVEMVNEELASLLYRSDVYIRTRKVNVMSLTQALSLEKSREFRDQLRLKIQKAGGIKAPGAKNRRPSRVPKLVDCIEDPKTAVQLQ